MVCVLVKKWNQQYLAIRKLKTVKLIRKDYIVRSIFAVRNVLIYQGRNDSWLNVRRVTFMYIRKPRSMYVCMSRVWINNLIIWHAKPGGEFITLEDFEYHTFVFWLYVYCTMPITPSKVHMLQSTTIANCTCCKVHVFQCARVAKSTCCKVQK